MTDNSDNQNESNEVWVSKWIDCSIKYGGMAYKLSDGSIGMLFKDGTNVILSDVLYIREK